jgi:hypothetical protein
VYIEPHLVHPLGAKIEGELKKIQRFSSVPVDGFWQPLVVVGSFSPFPSTASHVSILCVLYTNNNQPMSFSQLNPI